MTNSHAVFSLNDGDEYLWDEYVQSHEESTFFHLSGWKKLIKESFGHKPHYLYVEKDGEWTGILPLIRVKSLLFGDGVISIPFGVYGGILASDQDSAKLLENEAIKIMKESGSEYLELRNLNNYNSSLPTKSLYVTFKKTIDKHNDELLKEIPRKQRAMIRKGIKAKLKANFNNDLDCFYSIYSESVRNLGTPVLSKKYFRNILSIFGESVSILTVYDEELPVASVMSFYFKKEVLPYYGGGTYKARSVMANDFMYWELMNRSVDQGIKVFDYGRSKIDSGSYRFKKHWGFEPQPLYYQYKLKENRAMPNISPNNPKYKLFINAWRHLPLPIANSLGPHLAKYLG